MSLRDIGVPRELVSSSSPITSRNLWPDDRAPSISEKETKRPVAVLLSPVGVLFQESTPPWTTKRFPRSLLAKSGGLAPENETKPDDALTDVGTECKGVDAAMPASVFTSNEARSDEQIAQVDEAMQAKNSEIFSETPAKCAGGLQELEET